MLQQLQELIPIQYLIVAAAVLAVLFVITLLFRGFAGRSGGPESSRLAISETLEVDKHRRLVLVRRDDVEHLVLIGGGQDVVVEAAIRPGFGRREEMPATPRVIPGDRLEPEPEPAPSVARQAHAVTRPVPLKAARPAVFGDQAPAPEPADRPEPRFEAFKQEDKTREA
jgi:hypothetical protein